jgi:translation initiation factor 5
MLNIPSTIEDPSYRYQMPRLDLKIEGKGNGIKTNIVNLYDVAKALRVPIEYPLKFLGHEVGTLTLFKENKNEITSIINGAFNEEELRKHLDKFIEKYVICPNCKLPEMVLKVRKNNVCGSCNSCGAKPILDNIHKLTAFILKNPPTNVKVDIKESEKDKNKKEAKTATKTGDKKKNGEKSPREEKGSSSTSKVVFSMDNMDTYIQKMKEEYDQFKDYTTFDEKKDDIEKLIQVAKAFKVPPAQREKITYMVFNGIFTVNIAKEIQKNRAILDSFYEALELTNAELDLLVNLEDFLYVKNKEVQWEKYVPTILKLFYDEDLLTEEVILNWADNKFEEQLKTHFRYSKEVDEQFKVASKPIIDWLRASEAPELQEASQN